MPGTRLPDIVTARADYAKLDRPGARCASASPASASGPATRRTDASPGRRGRLRRGGQVFTWSAGDLRPGLLEHDDPLSLPGTAGAAEGGAAQAGQDAAGLHQRRLRNWTAFQKLGVASVYGAGRLPHLASGSTGRWISAAMPPSARRKADPGAHDPHAMPAGPGPSSSRTAPAGPSCWRRRSRPSSATSATSSAARWPAAASIRRATSPPSPSTAGRTATRPEYNPLFEPDCRRAQQPNVVGRARFGRITIANSDAGAAAYTDSRSTRRSRRRARRPCRWRHDLRRRSGWHVRCGR
jgi:spermidine dehydrogenase